MSEFAELYGTPDLIVLRFFKEQLEEVLCRAVMDRDQLIYNASVLAATAQTPVGSTSAELPMTPTIRGLFQEFVETNHTIPPEIWEQAAGQCLLHSSFFYADIARRNNLTLWSRIGSGLFIKASHVPGLKKSQLMVAMARNFEMWRRINACLARKFAKQLKPS